MGSFPTGVTVVAALGEDGSPCGLTVNAFTSVSLDPPLVLVCVDLASSSHDPLVTAPGFTVNILAASQEEVATRFAFDPADQRFRDGTWHAEEGGVRLEGVCAWLHCSLEAVHPGGDHSILVGRARSWGMGEGEALAFHRGRYGTVSQGPA